MAFKDLAKEMYEGSWCTIEGAGGSLDEWKKGIQNIFDEHGIGKVARWETYTGADMNREYHLTGRNSYQSDLTFLSFPLTDLNVGKLSVVRFQFGGRWFDDIVANNKAREEEK